MPWRNDLGVKVKEKGGWLSMKRDPIAKCELLGLLKFGVTRYLYMDQETSSIEKVIVLYQSK